MGAERVRQQQQFEQEESKWPTDCSTPDQAGASTPRHHSTNADLAAITPEVNNGSPRSAVRLAPEDDHLGHTDSLDTTLSRQQGLHTSPTSQNSEARRAELLMQVENLHSQVKVVQDRRAQRIALRNQRRGCPSEA